MADDFDEPEFDSFEDDYHDIDCSMMPDGQCMQAGTEWCDLECPIRRQSENVND